MSYVGESARHVGAFDHVNIGNASFAAVNAGYLKVEGSADLVGNLNIGGAMEVDSLDVVNGVTAGTVTVTGAVSSQSASVLGHFSSSTVTTESIVATTGVYTTDFFATGAVHLGDALTVSGALHLALQNVPPTDNDNVKQVLYNPDTGAVTFGSVTEVALPDNANFTDIAAQTGTVSTLQSSNATIQHVQATVADVTTVNAETVNASNANADVLTAAQGTINQLTSPNGSIAALSSTNATLQTAAVTNLNATTAAANTLTATNGTINTLNATSTTSGSITASSSLVSNGPLTAAGDVFMTGINQQITLSTLYYSPDTGKVTFGDSPAVTGGGGGDGGGGGSSVNPIGNADLLTLKVSGASTFGTEAQPATITSYGEVSLNGLSESVKPNVLYYDTTSGKLSYSHPVTSSVNDTELVDDGNNLNTSVRVSVVFGQGHELPDAVTRGTIKTIINGNESAYKKLGTNSGDFNFANHRAYYEQRFQRLVADADGNLYTIGILFNQYSGANAQYGTGVSIVVKYTKATNTWAVMREDGKTGYFNGCIADLAVDSRGNVYACGAFTHVNKTYDATSITATGFLTADGGTQVNFIARWDSTLLKWEPIVVGTLTGLSRFGSSPPVTDAYFSIDCLYIDLSDNVWFGSRSDATANGSSPWGKYLTRYTHTDGFFESFYTPFGEALQLEPNQGVYSIALDESIQPGLGHVVSKVYIYCHSAFGRTLILCGTIEEAEVGGFLVPTILSWNACGSTSPLRPIEVGTTLTYKHMYSLHFGNGKLYVASFNRYGAPLDMSNVIFGNFQAMVYNPADDTWSPLGAGVTGAPQSSNEQLEIQGTMYPYPTFSTPRLFSFVVDGSNLYAVGLFTRAIQSDNASIFANNVVWWDGTVSKWRSLGVGLKLYDSAVTTAVKKVGDSLYFSGMFFESGDSSTLLNQVAELQLNKLCRITGKFTSNDTPQDELVLSIAQEQVSVMWNGTSWLILKSE